MGRQDEAAPAAEAKSNRILPDLPPIDLVGVGVPPVVDGHKSTLADLETPEGYTLPALNRGARLRQLRPRSDRNDTPPRPEDRLIFGVLSNSHLAQQSLLDLRAPEYL